MLPTVRRSMVAVFWAFVLFLFASIALGQTADPVAPFDAVGRLHPEVAITYAIFTHSGEIELLAVLLGGLPILFTTVKRAFAGGPFSVLKLFLIKPKQALLLFGAALLISICFVGYILATEYIFGSPSPPCPAAQQCLGLQSPGLLVLDLAAIIGSITLGVFVGLGLSASLSLAGPPRRFGLGWLPSPLFPLSPLPFPLPP